MKLKHKKEVKIIVDYNDIEQLIEEVYEQPYEFVADVECNNDIKKSYTVKKGQMKTSTAKWIKQDLDNFKENGNYSYLAGKLLNDLADKDIIEEGSYLINVSW